MKKFGSLFLLSFLFVSNLLACPYCVGTTQGGKDSNTTIILGLFILSIYIPYLIIYRLIKKQRALAPQLEVHDHSGPTQS